MINRYVHGNPVHPGAQTRLLIETVKGFPEVVDDFLNQIISVINAIGINGGHFINQAFV
jgi:hypothetical protein